MPAGSDELPIEAAADDARLLVLGGEPLGERIEMWWNFVARDKEEITAAWRDWHDRTDRFGEVHWLLARIDAPRPPGWGPPTARSTAWCPLTVLIASKHASTPERSPEWGRYCRSSGPGERSRQAKDRDAGGLGRDAGRRGHAPTGSAAVRQRFLSSRGAVRTCPVITGATGAERSYYGYPDVAREMIDNRTFHDRLQLVAHRPRVLEHSPLHSIRLM